MEEETRKIFPHASVLRMDLDTTSGQEGHRNILEKFASHEADILIGTQMIVKGHDFADVRLSESCLQICRFIAVITGLRRLLLIC